MSGLCARRVPENKLRLHLAPDVGGGFVGRGEDCATMRKRTCCCLLIAKRAINRPVKWVATRSEVVLWGRDRPWPRPCYSMPEVGA